ncbi:MAG: hypothetical protein QM718_10860 [Steroidobacteraceae bacterium]
MNGVKIEQAITEFAEQGLRALQDPLARQRARRQVRRQSIAGGRAPSAGEGQVSIVRRVASINQALTDVFGLTKLNYNGLGDQSITVLQSLRHAIMTPAV